MSGDPLSDRQLSRQHRSRQDDHQSVGEFIEENYRLLTILGVLATLSLSFPQFQDTLTIGGRIGVGSSLLLFGVILAIAFARISNAFNEAAQAAAYGSVAGYSAVIIALLGLTGAMAVVVREQYAEAAEIVGSGSLTLAAVSIYFVRLAQSSYLHDYRPQTVLGEYSNTSPQLAGVLLCSYWYLMIPDRSISLATTGDVLEFVAAALMIHLVATFSIAALSHEADRILDKQLDRFNEWATGEPGDPLIERAGPPLRLWLSDHLERYLPKSASEYDERTPHSDEESTNG